jgi:hypothetical protein
MIPTQVPEPFHRDGWVYEEGTLRTDGVGGSRWKNESAFPTRSICAGA